MKAVPRIFVPIAIACIFTNAAKIGEGGEWLWVKKK